MPRYAQLQIVLCEFFENSFRKKISFFLDSNNSVVFRHLIVAETVFL